MSEHRLPKSPRALKALLEERGLRLTKERGQNFLVDTNVLEGIAADAAVQPNSLVLEIGSGAGALSEYLLEQAALLVAIDIDRGMVDLLAEALSHHKNLMLIEGDVLGAHNQLNAELSCLLEKLLAGQPVADSESLRLALTPQSLPDAPLGLHVVANLPYSITSPVIIALLESSLPIQSLTLLVQLEVADKICAASGSNEWGLLSLLVQLHGEAEVLRKVGKNVFWPPPKVASALIRITPNQARDRAAIEALKSVIAPVFRYRRKSLGAGIKHGLGLKGDEIDAALASAGIERNTRIEQLSIPQLEELAAALHKAGA